MLTRVIIIAIIWLGVDAYAYQAIKTALNFKNQSINSTILWLYWLVDIFLILTIVYFSINGKFSHGPNKNFNWLMGLMMISLLPKIVIIPFVLLEDFVRIIEGTIVFLKSKFSNQIPTSYVPERRKFVSQIALSVASIPFLGTIYGVTKGKYDYRVHKVKLAFKDLPEAFHGFTITQLSDIHAGSFDDAKAVQRGIDLANEQNSDLIVFTGDLVNNHAEEMKDWIEHFKQLTATYGKYSILGNHDYGDYIQWKNESAKQKNFINLVNVHQEIGFNLLRNDSVFIEKDNQKIALIGVENWGKKGFVKHGDLDKASENIDDNYFKLLLSHDPSHWEAQVLKHKKNFHLTLSGHTHGMQFGIEIPGFKWSPSKYIYPQWAGSYKSNEKYIYVNRGFGFLGLPGRVGILPEITVIELIKA